MGVGARTLGECLALQLAVLDPATPGRELALQIVAGPLERLPRSGVAGLAHELKRSTADVDQAVQLVRSLDPRPGKQIGDLSQDTYVVPDCVIWRQRGIWRASLAGRAQPKVTIHRGYENLIRSCGESDAGYLRGQLQEARWLLKSLEARGETLLRVVRCLLKHQSGFLEFGAQALRPLTLREIAGEPRPARIDHFPRDRAQIRAHPARHHCAALVLRLRHRYRQRRRGLQHRHSGDDPAPDRCGKPAQAVIRCQVGRSAENFRRTCSAAHRCEVS